MYRNRTFSLREMLRDWVRRRCPPDPATDRRDAFGTAADGAEEGSSVPNVIVVPASGTETIAGAFATEESDPCLHGGRL